MAKKKSGFREDYKKYYSDVLDYLLGVNEKFSTHNTFLFLIYGIGLSIIEIEFKKVVCGLCFGISAVSLINVLLSKYYLPQNRKRTTLVYNIYLIIFLILLTLMYLSHPSHMAYTILICSIITTAMTSMSPLRYGIEIVGTCLFDIILYFLLSSTNDVIVIVGYLINNFLVVAFTIGINILYVNMKFKEFKQKHFLQNESYHDPLTKIYNRRFVEQYVEMNLDVNDACAMFLIDVDNFKTANDIFGHEIGDQVLCKISDCLRNSFRKSDCVARIGGDEFIILMPRITEQVHAEKKVRKILAEFPIMLKSEDGKKEVEVSLSIGVVFSKAGERIEYEEMYRRADVYMYKAKKREKGIAVLEAFNGAKEKKVSLKKENNSES